MIIPKIVYLQLTSQCNQDCIVCPHQTSNTSYVNKYMSDEIFNKVIEDLLPIKDQLKFISLAPFPGEPTMDIQLPKRLHTLRNLFPNVILTMLTNGSNITSEFLSTLPQNMTIAVSLLGSKSGEYSYENMTGNTWEHFLEVMNILSESGRRSLIAGTHYDTYNLIDTYKDLNNLKNTVISINKMVLDDTSFNNGITTDIENCKSFINEFKKISNTLVFLINSHERYNKYIVENNEHRLFLLSELKNLYCNIPVDQIHIMADGNIPLCPCYSTQPFIVGNILNENLINIFNNDIINNIRIRLDKGIPGCLHCKQNCTFRFNSNIPKELYI